MPTIDQRGDPGVPTKPCEIADALGLGLPGRLLKPTHAVAQAMGLLVVLALAAPAEGNDDPPQPKTCAVLWCEVPDGQRERPPRPLKWENEYDSPKDIWTPDGIQLWLVGLGGQILYSPDGGHRWETQVSGTEAHFYSVHGARDGQHVWAAGESLVYRAPGSKVWRALDSADRPRFFEKLFADSDGLWAAGFPEFDPGAGSTHSPRTLYFSGDRGSTWSVVHDSISAFAAVADGGKVHVWVAKEGALGYAANPLKPDDFVWTEAWFRESTYFNLILGPEENLVPSLDGQQVWLLGGHFGLGEFDPTSRRVRLTDYEDGLRFRISDGLATGSGFIWLPGSRDRKFVKEDEIASAKIRFVPGLRLARSSEEDSVFALSPGGNLDRCSLDGGCRTLRHASAALSRLLPPVAEDDQPIAFSDHSTILARGDRGSWAQMPGTPAKVVFLGGTPDGKRQFTVGAERNLFTRSASERAWKRLWRFPTGHEKYPHFSSDETGERLWLATWDAAGQVHLWYSDTGGRQWNEIEHPGGVLQDMEDMDTFPDGSALWTLFEGGVLRRWSATEGWGEPLIRKGPNRFISWQSMPVFLCLNSSFDGPRRGNGLDFTCVDHGGRSWLLEHGFVSRLASGEIWRENSRSVDGGRSWMDIGLPANIRAFPWVSVPRIDGSGKRLWLQTNGGISTAVLGDAAPQIDEFRLRPAPFDGGLGARLELRLSHVSSAVPDTITMTLLGLSEAQLENGDEHRSLDGARLIRPDDASGVWAFELDPADKPLFLKPGDVAHFEVTVETNTEGVPFRQAFTIPPAVHDPWHLLRQNAAWLVPAAALALLLATLTALVYLRPLALLRVRRWLRLYRLVEQLKIPVIGPTLTALLELTILPAFVRHRKTLDAWIEQHRERLDELFKASHAMEVQVAEPGATLNEEPDEEPGYVALPVRQDDPEKGKLIHRPRGSELATFFRKRVVLQILGPGGAGKTSLAIQIGRWASAGDLSDHPMASVLVDEDTSDLRAVLLRKLRSWLNDEIESDFLDALLRKRRLLIVVDRLSERKPSTRDHVAKIHGQLPVNALVVTARFSIGFGVPEVVDLFPEPLDTNNLLYFISSKLQSAKARDEFPTMEGQLALADRLAKVVRLGRQKLPLRPLVVTWYVDQAIVQMRKTGHLDDLPTSVPEVYFRYLRQVNPDGDVRNRLEDDSMLRAAEVLAQMALTDKFVPGRDFLKSRARKKLAAEGWDKPQECDPIQRLIDNGVLVDETLGTDTWVSFSLDPVAELLAAMSKAKKCGSSVEDWENLLSQIRKAGKSADGFASAFRLVHDAYAQKYDWPELPQDFFKREEWPSESL